MTLRHIMQCGPKLPVNCGINTVKSLQLILYITLFQCKYELYLTHFLMDETFSLGVLFFPSGTSDAHYYNYFRCVKIFIV